MRLRGTVRTGDDGNDGNADRIAETPTWRRGVEVEPGGDTALDRDVPNGVTVRDGLRGAVRHDDSSVAPHARRDRSVSSGDKRWWARDGYLYYRPNR